MKKHHKHRHEVRTTCNRALEGSRIGTRLYRDLPVAEWWLAAAAAAHITPTARVGTHGGRQKKQCWLHRNRGPDASARQVMAAAAHTTVGRMGEGAAVQVWEGALTQRVVTGCGCGGRSLLARFSACIPSLGTLSAICFIFLLACSCFCYLGNMASVWRQLASNYFC